MRALGLIAGNRSLPLLFARQARLAGVERLVLSTYQSVSGAGQVGLRELDEQWTKGAGQMERLRRAGAIEGAIEPGEQWDRPIAGNVIPLAGSMKELGYTSEEWKMIRETRKILHDDEIRSGRHRLETAPEELAIVPADDQRRDGRQHRAHSSTTSTIRRGCCTQNKCKRVSHLHRRLVPVTTGVTTAAAARSGS
jgi:hypothetical protein